MSTLPTIRGLSVLDGWIDEAQEQALLAAVDASPWRDDLSRRVQHYGFRYDYRARSVDASMRLGPLPPWAAVLAERIHQDGLTDRPPDQVIVNEYQPGQGISRHVDCVPCFGPTVLSLSLSSGCAMDLHGPDAAAPIPIALRPRSLLVLSDEARSRWGHAIPGRKSDLLGGVRVPRSRRVSLTFRTVRLAGAALL